MRASTRASTMRVSSTSISRGAPTPTALRAPPSFLVVCFDTLFKTCSVIGNRSQPVFDFGEGACVSRVRVRLAPHTFDNSLIDEEEVQAYIILLSPNEVDELAVSVRVICDGFASELPNGGLVPTAVV